ncbi:MAG: hypothetical protein ABI947_28705 [Chloroflexota bacterium]
MGIWLIVLSQSQRFPLSIVAMFFAGTATTVVWDGALGLLQVFAPETIRIQLFSIFGLMGFGLLPIASLLLGIIADHITTSWTVFLSGLAMVVFSGLMLMQRKWRTWQTQPTQT